LLGVRPILRSLEVVKGLRATDSAPAIMRAKHCSLAQQSMLQRRYHELPSPSNQVIQAISERLADRSAMPSLYGRWIK